MRPSQTFMVKYTAATKCCMFHRGYKISDLLIKLVTDTAWKPNFCRKTRNDMSKRWHNVQSTVFYCIWCLLRHVWHVCFHISNSSCALMRHNTFNFQGFFLNSSLQSKKKKNADNIKVALPSTWIKSLSFTVLMENPDKVINAKVNSYQECLSAIRMLPIEAFIYFTLISS